MPCARPVPEFGRRFLRMVDVTLRRTLPVADGLGECILWDERSSQAIWTDIPGRRVHLYDPATESIETLPVHEELCSFGFTTDPKHMVCAFKSGIAITDAKFTVVDWIHRLQGPDCVRLNDGRVDRHGRFWVGSMIDNDGNQPSAGCSGELLSLDSAGTVTSHLSGVRISNSLCWAPDGMIMYFGDTPEREIYAFEFDNETGRPGKQSVFATTPTGTGPDGSTVDAEGCLWNAEWGHGRVVRYTPDGDVDHEIQLPVSNITCVAFGGHEYSDLYVTTAKHGLDEQQSAQQPEAGNVFVFETSVRGLAEHSYQLLGYDDT